MDDAKRLEAERQQSHELEEEAAAGVEPRGHQASGGDERLGRPLALHGAFEVVVVDPPVITEAVWRRYAEAACVLLRGDGRGRAICTTVAENLPLLRELFPGMERTNFQPSIPHLVYQYDLFANADFAAFREANAELS